MKEHYRKRLIKVELVPIQVDAVGGDLSDTNEFTHRLDYRIVLFQQIVIQFDTFDAWYASKDDHQRLVRSKSFCETSI